MMVCDALRGKIALMHSLGTILARSTCKIPESVNTSLFWVQQVTIGGRVSKPASSFRE